MIIIGIISVPKKRTSLAGMLTGGVRIKEEFGDNPTYLVAETAAGERDLARMRKISVARIIRRAERKLRRLGAMRILMAENCREYAPFLKERIYKSYSIPAVRIFEGFEAARKMMGYNVIKNVLVTDRELTAVSYEKLVNLCKMAEKISVCTTETERAEEMAERLFYEYGVCIQIRSEVCDEDRRKVQAVIDTDNAKVRIGDFCIDGAEFRSKSGDYKTDAAEETACLGEENTLEIEKWISGNRAIKIG